MDTWIQHTRELDPSNHFEIEQESESSSSFFFLSLEELEKNYYLKKDASSFDIKKYFLPATVHQLWMRYKNSKNSFEPPYLYGKNLVFHMKTTPQDFAKVQTIYRLSSSSLGIETSPFTESSWLSVEEQTIHKVHQLYGSKRKEIKKTFGLSPKNIEEVLKIGDTTLSLEIWRDKDTQVPRYLVKKLGAGGFGTVYHRMHLKKEKIDTIKVAFDNPRAENEIANEAKILTHIYKGKPDLWGVQSRPRKIVDLSKKIAMDSISSGGKKGLLIQKCEGDLFDFLEKTLSSFEEFRELFICHQILSGLKSIHQANVAHCDMKLENILIKNFQTIRLNEKKMELPIVQIGDFGGAIDKNNVEMRIPTVTTANMIWEDFEAEKNASSPKTLLKIGQQHDIFSAGIILYGIFKGERVFPLEEKGEGSFSIATHYSPLFPVEEGEALHPLDDLIKSMLHPERDQRPLIQSVFNSFEKIMGKRYVKITKKIQKKIG